MFIHWQSQSTQLHISSTYQQSTIKYNDLANIYAKLTPKTKSEIHIFIRIQIDIWDEIKFQSKFSWTEFQCNGLKFNEINYNESVHCSNPHFPAFRLRKRIFGDEFIWLHELLAKKSFFLRLNYKRKHSENELNSHTWNFGIEIRFGRFVLTFYSLITVEAVWILFIKHCFSILFSSIFFPFDFNKANLNLITTMNDSILCRNDTVSFKLTQNKIWFTH